MKKIIVFVNTLFIFFFIPFIVFSEKSQQQSIFNFNSSSPSPKVNKFVYYPQCDGEYDDLPMPNGCYFCEAGCGLATTAMILSSYVDKKFTPAAVIDLYKQKGLYAGCKGSKITDHQEILQENGLKTTDLMVYNSNNDAVEDFKSYINSGWTIFALGRFCSNDCQHFFWITNIDENNNVWAYDPFYGKQQMPPINENKYQPFPNYRMAFGVKKM